MGESGRGNPGPPSPDKGLRPGDDRERRTRGGVRFFGAPPDGKGKRHSFPGGRILLVFQRFHDLAGVDAHDASVFPRHGPSSGSFVPRRFGGRDQDELPADDFQLRSGKGWPPSLRVSLLPAAGQPFLPPLLDFLLSLHVGGSDSCRNHGQSDVQFAHASHPPHRKSYPLDESGEGIDSAQAPEDFFLAEGFYLGPPTNRETKKRTTRYPIPPARNSQRTTRAMSKNPGSEG